MAELLKSCTIAPSEGHYLITLEGDDGDSTEFLVTFDQLDLISEEIDRQLNAEEENELSVDGDNDED